MMTGTEIKMGALKIGNVMRYRITRPAKIHAWKRARDLVAISSSKEFVRCPAAILIYYSYFVIYKNNKSSIFSLQKCWLADAYSCLYPRASQHNQYEVEILGLFRDLGCAGFTYHSNTDLSRVLHGFFYFLGNIACQSCR